MFIKAKGKKKCIKRASILALAGVITVGTVLATTQQAMAKPTLPGVEKIILDNSTENPFVILEIVPDMADASLGYFVAGEEPVDDSGKSIKDMPSKEERVARFAASTAEAKINSLGIGDAVALDKIKDSDENVIGTYEELQNAGDGKKSVDIRGVFTEDKNGDYVKSAVDDMYRPIKIVGEEQTPGENEARLSEINSGNINLYRKYVSFDVDKEADSLNTKYKVNLSVLEDTSAVPVDITDMMQGQQISSTLFNGQFFVAKPIEFDVYEREIPDENETDNDSNNESNDGQGNTSNNEQGNITNNEQDSTTDKKTETVIEYINPPKAGDLIFKVEGDNLKYVGVMESNIDVATLSLRIADEEAEDTHDEEGVEGDGTVDDIVDGSGDVTKEGSNGGEVDGDNQENGSGNTGNGTDIPGQGQGEGTNGADIPGQDPNSEKPGNELPENQNSGSEGNSGGNTENINDTVRLNNAEIALRRAGFFIPTQIGMMYRMSVSLQKYKETIEPAMLGGAKYVIVKEADGGDTDVEYYYYISGIEAATDDGGIYATASYGEIIRPSGGYGSESDNYDAAYYIGKTFYQYTTENLPYTYATAGIVGTHSFTADYTQQVYDTFTYNGGFSNEEWFKQFVFDVDKSQNMSIDVVPVTMDELTQEHLDKADLIYFANASNGEFKLASNTTLDNSGTTEENGEGENSGDASTGVEAGQSTYDAICKAILKKASENIPVVMDYGLYANENNNETLRKMAACLLHNDILEPFGEVGLGDSKKTISSLGLDVMKTTMKQPMEGSTSLSYVKGNIFIYDNAVVSGDFNNEIYTQEEISYGFQELLDEIENENFYLEVAGKKDNIESRVTMATAIRHIINFGDRRNVTKTTLRVLDLEPYDFEKYYNGTLTSAYNDIYYKEFSSNLTVRSIVTDSICLTKDGKLDKEQWIIDNLAPQFAENRDDLDVTIMGTKEFVGKIEDINENYDLIYLGMDTSIMNTRISRSGKKNSYKYDKTDETVYNDPNMKGLVYTHVGDEVQVKSGKISGSDNRYINGVFRLSGNDITSDKLRELTEFIEAGYAVIISDEMVTVNGDTYEVNKTKVDEASNMYKLLSGVILKRNEDDGKYRYFGKNVNVKSAFESSNKNAVANRETFSRYMGISKLILEYSEEDIPRIYDESDRKPDYLPVDSDGVCRLNFRIKLRNDAAVDLVNTNYNCKLYVDIDADGRYAEDEILSGLHITDGSGSEKLPDEKGKYHLRTGNTYRISRAVPEGYTGFISWKLVFEQNDQEYDKVSSRSLVRTAVEGYSAVQRTSEKPLIKILQITSGGGDTNLKLKDDDYMKTLYNDSKLDFRIDVSVISAKNFVAKKNFGNKTHAEYLKEYDMLVMGFYDSFKVGEGKSNEAAHENSVNAMLAIREYALSGRSILFTHDLSGFNLTEDSEKTWSWYANRILRDIQGMDRFGVMSSYKLVPDEEKYKYESKYDTSSIVDKVCYNDGKNPKDAGEAIEAKGKAQGLNNVLLANSEYKFTNAVTYAETSRGASWIFKWSQEYTNNGKTQSLQDVAVSQVNKGQITEYPFHISESFNVSGTHSQYMQLNLDTDSRDEYTNDDIVVWYTLDKRDDSNLKDSMYTALEKDVRNNYFIFNKGNITYTGSGHRSVTSEEEKRLFLNTLVAAYRAGMHAPRVLYKENEWNTSATITGKYLPYDPQMVRNTGEVDDNGNPVTGGFLEETLPVHFYTTNENLQLTNEELYAEYYIHISDDEAQELLKNPEKRVLIICLDEKYYKKVTPVKVERLVEEAGQVTRANENALRPANNSMHTATFKYEDIGLGDTSCIT